MSDYKSLVLKPLVLALFLILARLALELADASQGIQTLFGVAWLYLLVPFYFARAISRSGEARPFSALFKLLAGFAFATRLLVAPTYWLAYAWSWSAPRFALENGGVVGEGVSSLEGYLLIPFRNLVIWTVLATLVGMVLGGGWLFAKRRSAASEA